MAVVVLGSLGWGSGGRCLPKASPHPAPRTRHHSATSLLSYWLSDTRARADFAAEANAAAMEQLEDAVKGEGEALTTLAGVAA